MDRGKNINQLCRFVFLCSSQIGKRHRYRQPKENIQRLKEAMDKTYGVISQINNSSSSYGPGKRVVVFFKGCNLRCFWCPKPATMNLEPEVQVYKDKCNGCRKCVMACSQNAIRWNTDTFIFSRELCIKCGKCVEVCDTGALSMTGRYLSDEDLQEEINEVYADADGITFTGGEVLLQHEFLRSLLIKNKELGRHTTVVTSGNVLVSRFTATAPYTDLFIYDIKTLDAKTHKKATGASNGKILSNLIHLNSIAKEIHIRMTIIPGFNDTEQDLKGVIDLVSALDKVTKIELNAFVNNKRREYESLDMPYKADSIVLPGNDRMLELASFISSHGFETNIVP